MDQINLLFEPLFDFLESVPQAGPWYTNTIRFVMPFLALGVLIALIRVIGGVHFPRDVLSGAVLGAACGAVGFWLIP